MSELTTSRIGSTTRRSSTRLLRSSNERRCTSLLWALSSNSRSSSASISESSTWIASK